MKNIIESKAFIDRQTKQMHNSFQLYPKNLKRSMFFFKEYTFSFKCKLKHFEQHKFSGLNIN